MLVSKLVPLLVMGGIGLHSGGAIKDRMGGMLGAKDKMLAKQRIVALLDAAALDVSTGGRFDVGSPQKFRSWAKRAVRIRGSNAADSSLDPWGTPLVGVQRGNTLTVTSAGVDKKLGTKDDVSASADIYDF